VRRTNLLASASELVKQQRQLLVMPLEEPLPLRANVGWTFLSNGIYAGCQWAMLAALAKLGTPQMVGQFSLGLAITSPVLMLTNLQLRAIQATDARNEYHFSDYLALRLIMSGLGMLIIVGIVLVSDFLAATALLILAIGLAKIIESVSDIIYGLMQKHERMDRIAISKMVKGPLSLIGLAVLVWLTDSVFIGTLGLLVPWLALLLVYDLGNARRLTDVRLRMGIATLWRLARLAFPLGVVMMLVSLNGSVPRYFVVHHWGEEELGYFAATAYLMTAGSLVVRALGQSVSPRLAGYYAEGNSAAFRLLLLKLLGIAVLLGGGGVVLAIVAGRGLLALLYQADYAKYNNVFIWLMVAAGISYVASFLGYGMTAARRFRVQAPLFALTTGTTTLACAILVPARGSAGAGIALVISGVVQTVGSLAVVRYALNSRVADRHREASP